MHLGTRTSIWTLLLVAFFGVHVYLTKELTSPRPAAKRSETGQPVTTEREEHPVGPERDRRQEHLLRLDLEVELLPVSHSLAVTARVAIPTELRKSGQAEFFLHSGLTVTSATPGVELQEQGMPQPGNDTPLIAYHLRFPPDEGMIEIRYEGEIYHPVEEYGEDYARSFGWTRGVIGAEYVYLAPASGWYPIFAERQVGFRIDIRMPAGWTAVSQGGWSERSQSEGRARVVWEEAQPQDGIYLLAAPFHLYERSTGTIAAQVFLRSEDAELATRYLEATDQYLDLYQELLGPYPYAKFALVENFWETGYGMPSFTLLGPTVIRLPFIATSSYPHEILHNWWGNGVYVDYTTGNWSEGLTAYLSDHLIQEQRGKGAEHRQSSLQKYVDYVAADRDFPLNQFRSRHGSASQAVGYTKVMMMMHMLRMELGDEVFIAALRNFYHTHQFETASFADLARAFSHAAGRSQEVFFEQWVERGGAPEIVLETTRATPHGSEYELQVHLRQVQEGKPYRLLVPLAATLEGRDKAEQIAVVLTGRELEWVWRLPARPLRIDVDPEFDLMRRLHPEEIPPALSGVFGAAKVAVILPAKATEAARAAYEALAQAWDASGNVALEMFWDDRLADLPQGQAVWLFGWENRFLERLEPTLDPFGASVNDSGAVLPGLSLVREGNAVALGIRHPSDPQWAIGVFAADYASTIPVLGRRLPHFHKYSFLAFEGEQADNTLRGRWPVVNSPLTGWPDTAVRGRIPMASLERRTPLIPAPPIVEKTQSF